MSDDQQELDELIFYIAGLKKSFNRKLDDHLFIIQRQNNRIDEQQAVIDELSWQLRELRDSVRQLNIKSNITCACNYENHIPKNVNNKNNSEKVTSTSKSLSTSSSSTEIRQDVRITFPDSDEEEEYDDEENIYEPIEYSTASITSSTSRRSTITRKTPKVIIHEASTSSSLPQETLTKDEPQRFGGGVGRLDPRVKNMLDRKNLLNLNEQQQHTQSLTEKRIQSPTNFGPLQFNDDLDDDDEELAGVVLRRRDFKVFARNSQRGSSKNICSLMSDIEEEYLPQSVEIREENLVDMPRGIVSDAAVDYRFGETGIRSRILKG